MAVTPLRVDDRQWLIHQPDTCTHVYEVMQAAAMDGFGWLLEQQARRYPANVAAPLAKIGAMLRKFGEAQQQVNAGQSTLDVPAGRRAAAESWDTFAQLQRQVAAGGASTDAVDAAADALDAVAAALQYVDQRTHETGTSHPRWNARLVSGQPCPHCGR